jgi:hypothetical protein
LVGRLHDRRTQLGAKVSAAVNRKLTRWRRSWFSTGTRQILRQAIAIYLAFVSVKEGRDGITGIEYVAGRRCDLQRRIEGRT